MSEILRNPKKLLLHGICKIPAGKAGKAAAKQYANERKARKRALARLAEADSQSGVGLLVMLNSADRRLGRYIFKKLDKVIPFYVKALSDGASGMPEEEMSWLMEACARRGYRTLWLDLTGTDKIDKRAVLHLVAGELVRVLEKPAPERASEAALAEAEVEPEAAVVEDLTEPEAAEGEPEVAEVEDLTEPEMAEATEMPEPEAAVDEPVEPEAVAEEETAASDMGTEIETVAEAIGELQEETIDDDKKCASEKFLTEAVRESEDIFAEKEPQDIDAVNAEDVIVAPKAEAIPVVEEKPVPEEKPAAEAIPVVEEKPVPEEKLAAEAIPVVEEKPAPGKRTKKTSTKAEGEKAPAKPRRKRAPAAPLTVEATLAKRRRQMGLE
ncbi:MAG: hypothetical protein IKF22_08100 [Lachnospiraceae bacterium]|nr:hypothetical protein [Lachnospiraceae bacterium]